MMQRRSRQAMTAAQTRNQARCQRPALLPTQLRLRRRANYMVMVMARPLTLRNGCNRQIVGMMR